MSYKHPHIREVDKGQVLTGRELLRRQIAERIARSQEQDVNSYAKGGFMGLNWSNPFKGEGATGMKEAGVSAAANVVGSMGNKVLSGGLSSGAGNVIGGLSNVASMIPGPWGAVASAGLQVIGGLTNRMFGSKLNEENIVRVKNDMAAMDANIATAGDFSTLESNMSGDISFSKKDIGKDGWFANKASKLYNKLNAQASILNDRKDISMLTSVNQIGERTTDNLLRNYAAYGGRINKFDGESGTSLLKTDLSSYRQRFLNDLNKLGIPKKKKESGRSINAPIDSVSVDTSYLPINSNNSTKVDFVDTWEAYMTASQFTPGFLLSPLEEQIDEGLATTTPPQSQTVNTKAVVSKPKTIAQPQQSLNTTVSTVDEGSGITGKQLLNQMNRQGTYSWANDFAIAHPELNEQIRFNPTIDTKEDINSNSFAINNFADSEYDKAKELISQAPTYRSITDGGKSYKNDQGFNWQQATDLSKVFAKTTAHKGTVTPISQTGNAIFDSIGNSVAGTLNIVDTLMKRGSSRWNDNRTLAQKIGLADGGSLKNKEGVLTGRELLRRQIAERVNKFSGEEGSSTLNYTPTDIDKNGYPIAKMGAQAAELRLLNTNPINMDNLTLDTPSTGSTGSSNGKMNTYMNAAADTLQLIGNAIDQGRLSVSKSEIRQAQQGTQRGGQVLTGFDIIEANRPQPMQHVNRYDFRKNTLGMDVVNALSAGNTGAMAGGAIGYGANSSGGVGGSGGAGGLGGMEGVMGSAGNTYGLGIGAAIGGTVGTLSSIAGSLVGRHKAHNEARKMNHLIDLGNARNDLAYSTSIEQTMERQVDNLLQNWAAYGGLLRRYK